MKFFARQCMHCLEMYSEYSFILSIINHANSFVFTTIFARYKYFRNLHKIKIAVNRNLCFHNRKKKHNTIESRAKNQCTTTRSLNYISG